MSMRINGFFEHDTNMKKQAESADNPATNASEFGGSGSGLQQISPSEQTASNSKTSSSNAAANRHRASIACASCRDRRIRVRNKSNHLNSAYNR
jgi:hypothetical protein